MSRFARPATKVLTLANGDTLTVRKNLSAGEHRAALARMYITLPDGTRTRDPTQTGISTVVAYLLDWSLTDEQGQQVIIRNVSIDELTAALDNLTPEDFREIREAIETHELAELQARADAKKKTTDGETPSDPTFPSPSAAAGASSGSASST